MTTQEKFTQAMQKLADERENFELIVDHAYANVGTYSFQFKDDFDPILTVPFTFSGLRADFSGGTNPVLGRNEKGGTFSAVTGDGFHAVIQRIEEILDGEREQGETDEDKARYAAAVRRRNENP